MHLGKQYLELASIDMKAAKLLYKNEIYNLAVYHLQQATEKTVKGACLTIPINSKGETLLKYQEITKEHDSAKLLVKACEKIQNILNSHKLLKPIASCVTPFISRIKQDLKNIYAKARQTKQQIKESLNLLNNLTEILQGVLKTNKNPEISNFFLFCFAPLATLSVVTFPHLSTTRYPDGKIKPIEYNKNMIGITQCFNDLLELLKKVHSRIFFND